jgi:hypothetical protein
VSRKLDITAGTLPPTGAKGKGEIVGPQTGKTGRRFAKLKPARAVGREPPAGFVLHMADGPDAF